MSGDLAEAKELIRRCRELRDAGKVEAVLRSEVQSRLRLIFRDSNDATWINHYSSGTETRTTIGTTEGETASRFIDNLVGLTTIEYEADLRISAKREQGTSQVKEHTAGLIRSGAPISQVRGVLSDTVEWYAYDVQLTPGTDPAHCTVENIQLVLAEELSLDADDDVFAQRLIGFLRKHLAREQSRPLTAEFLKLDIGLDSRLYKRSAAPLARLVEEGRTSDTSISLATELWSKFVDHLERDAAGFRASAYADEVYLCVLARLLSANVLAGRAIISEDGELQSILDGSHFLDQYHLMNMVELDYFGWLTRPGHIEKLLPVARDIQRDLFAYDFGWRAEEDLFGHLMAELARRSQRKLLGQEWTPAWLARMIAERCLDNLPEGEPPRIIDMCCGSGSILAEVLRAAKKRLGTPDILALHDVVTGFDIDPLAVSLSKTTWVVTLAEEIKGATSPIVIPVYHADSLFSVTPVSDTLPVPGEDQPILVSFDGATIELPQAIVQPQYRELFDRIIDWAYDEAMLAQRERHTKQISPDDAGKFLAGAAEACNTTLPNSLAKPLAIAVHGIATRMSELARINRNGIWAFILRNTYRPGLLSGQFNGLVSNPPWLALSGIGANPYRDVLTSRAKLYGIRPSGQSFLHLELGTTHLVHAVDRYLAPNASVACLVPGTIFNGHHHEPFRQRAFLSGQRAVPFGLMEVWQVEPGTFKYPGAALIGRKAVQGENPRTTKIKGFLAQQSGLEPAEFSTRKIGSQRTAWVLEKEGLPIAAGGMKEMPQQGADLMPRTAVCVEVLSTTGAERRVDTPQQGSSWSYTVKDAKELKNERFPGQAAPRFIHRIAQSVNLLPFLLGGDCPPIVIPAERDRQGTWHVYPEAEIRRMGLTQTARRFAAINKKLEYVGKGKSLQLRIDERGKLTKQQFGGTGFLIVSGAGGKHICAACLPMSSTRDLVIDQTLYWKAIPSREEAWYIVGMLNTHALTEAIAPFNPKGGFGERHIHTLPYRLIPPFSPGNDDHQKIAALAQEIETRARSIVAADAYLSDPGRKLETRRARIRAALSDMDEMKNLERLCSLALGITPEDEESEA